MILRAENLTKRYFRRTRQANNFLAVQQATLTLSLEGAELVIIQFTIGGEA